MDMLAVLSEYFANRFDCRLAYPGMWWRATILALVMCGVAPQQIGATVWEEHPTLRALIKMVVSSRYRFPTVDCGELDRSEMKKQEQHMRDEVGTCIDSLSPSLKLVDTFSILLLSEGV